jgi:muramoyltetrapeptide carboxypeptidase
MITQIRHAGLLDNAAAILLGDFTDCEDDPVKQVRAETGGTKPLRRQYTQPEAFHEIFAHLGVPVATNLPVGHGPNFAPLPLGARYRVTSDGAFTLTAWDWLR